MVLQIRVCPAMPQLRVAALPPALRAAADLQNCLPSDVWTRLTCEASKKTQHRCCTAKLESAACWMPAIAAVAFQGNPVGQLLLGSKFSPELVPCSWVAPVGRPDSQHVVTLMSARLQDAGALHLHQA